MNDQTITFAKGIALETFSEVSRADFARSYPEVPHKLAHQLGDHPLMQLDALAQMAQGLPGHSVEYNRADLPLGLNGEKAPANSIGIGETIRNIATTGSWAALKNIEQNPAYGALLNTLLEELRPTIEAKTGAMLKPQGFIFITSPNGITPYHFDPEHNILLQLAGSKVMTMFPAGDPRYAPDETHETYHTGGGRDLFWRDELLSGGREWTLAPGEALYVPVMSPHFVKNGPAPAVSLSITWRSEWSFAEADARAFNSLLRKAGVAPRAPGRWPATNRAKSLGWRIYRKVTSLR
ncbi:transcriptional regulator [Novosphingobium sp. AAP83]|uniref:transcriptional regulator n=1 Tax=Novosphingobium sp. AAP83 TaxID=1523425 RepID=UPI0006B97137|nr:transcriptional regulator [Novosphingobium sp. AAP83]KPF93827.1 transcriptional regulator [Novosphingobium sp. AAP83]